MEGIDAAPLAQGGVGAEALGAGGDRLPRRPVGDAGARGLLHAQQVQQGRQFAVRAAARPGRFEPRIIVATPRFQQGYPTRRRRPLGRGPRLDESTRLVQVLDPPPVQAGQRCRIGPMPVSRRRPSARPPPASARRARRGPCRPGTPRPTGIRSAARGWRRHAPAPRAVASTGHPTGSPRAIGGGPRTPPRTSSSRGGPRSRRAGARRPPSRPRPAGP